MSDIVPLEDGERKREGHDPAIVDHLASFPEQAPNPIVEVDLEGMIKYSNPVASKMFPGIKTQKLSHPFLQRLSQVFNYLVSTGKPFYERTIEFEEWVIFQSISFNPKTNILRIFGFDITMQARTSKALRVSRERYDLAMRGSNDGFWDWDMKTNQLYYSSRWKSMLGHEEHEINEDIHEWFSRVHPDDLEALKADIAGHINGQTSHFENEHRLQLKHGPFGWFLARGLAVRDGRGMASRLAGSLTDITERRADLEQLIKEAFYDSLTGLPNRALLTDRLHGALWNASRDAAKGFALLFLDMDRFKTVNDSFGHFFGDRLLVRIGERLKEFVSGEDTAARFGGDEFLVLVLGIRTEEEALAAARRLKAHLESVVSIENHEMVPKFSIGVATYDPEFPHPEQVIRNADTAMYYAKNAGRSQCKVFRAEMIEKANHFLAMENKLRKALRENRLRVYYQPIISCEEQEVVGFEALVRMLDEEGALVSPAAFIPVAEESGLIVPLGSFVMAQACHDLKTLHRQGYRDLNMSVNLSVLQFRYPDPVRLVQDCLGQAKIKPKYLKLELTESLFMEQEKENLDMLLELHDKGVSIVIDDFGTGFSSLAYLRDLPVDTLKIDQAFVKNIPGNKDQVAIVSAILALAGQLGLRVVVEGVSELGHLQFFKDHKDTYLQGFLFAKPMPFEEVIPFLENQEAMFNQLLPGQAKPNWLQRKIHTLTR